MKKVYQALILLLLLDTPHIPAAETLASPAVIGLSDLKSILEYNPHPSKTLRSGRATSLIYYQLGYKKPNTLRTADFEANAIELEFNEHEILSAIKLIHFEPNTKN